MVSGDFYIAGVSLEPTETDTPLVIDSNTVLPRPIAFQLLKSVSRWNAQVPEHVCSVDNHEFA